MVLVKFRTVQSKLYKIDLPSNANISQAKQEMSKEMGGNDPSSIKMIYKAKVLSDEVPISSLKLGEKDFILVNTPKSKPSNPPNPVEQVQKPLEAEPVPETSPKAEPLPLHAQPIPLNENPQAPAPEAGNVQEKFDDGVNKLVEIGFDRELAVQALTLARGNVDIAAELIITGQIGGDHSGQSSEDEAEDAPVNNAPNDIPEPPANPELPPELTNLSPDQAAETLLAALPQSEQDAIHRLQSLGNFPLLEVIQIYHACDKNEELAANILLSNLE